MYEIMKTMCLPDFHHNSFVTASWQFKMYLGLRCMPKCKSCHESIVMISGRTQDTWFPWFHIYIYIYIHFLCIPGQPATSVAIVKHIRRLWPFSVYKNKQVQKNDCAAGSKVPTDVYSRWHINKWLHLRACCCIFSELG